MKNGTRIKKRVIDVDINVKVNVDADKAIEKLERIRDLYKEINELKNEKISISINNKEDAKIIRSNQVQAAKDFMS